MVRRLRDSEERTNEPTSKRANGCCTGFARSSHHFGTCLFNRAGAGNLLPINGPQVINAVVTQTNVADPAFRTTELGYPTGITDPSKFDPLAANITYMPRDFHSSPVQSWHISVQRSLGPNMLLDVADVGNRADDLLLAGIQQNFRGANNDRPNMTGDSYAPADQQTITNWFNKANVVIPTDPSQPFGNATRNSVRWPGFWQIDFSASKQVPLAGPTRLELRFEAFNLLNKTNFRAPNGNRSAAGFGTITATYDARQLQLGAKLLW